MRIDGKPFQNKKKKKNVGVARDEGSTRTTYLYPRYTSLVCRIFLFVRIKKQKCIQQWYRARWIVEIKEIGKIY